MAADADQVVEVLSAERVESLWQPVVGMVSAHLRDYMVSTRILPGTDSADQLITEASRILAQCSPPNEEVAPRTGLVCGFVQSGKTASMTAVAALAKDNGYRIIILIAGTTTNLVSQNRDRLETHLREASPDWTWLMLSNPRVRTDQVAVERLAEEWRSEHYDESDRRTLFISVIKHYSRLEDLAGLLERSNLPEVPAIIFDDEADQASLDMRPNDEVASSTYRSIEALRRTLPRHTYLQYTATPQAPLLITRIDSLSADFAELVSPGEGYTGGRVFFGTETPHVKIIPQAEIYRDGHLPVAPPESLLKALQAFFVGVAAGRLGAMHQNRSMLIHPSKATETHRRYYDWANRLSDEWHRVLLAQGEHDRDELLLQFRAAYDDIALTCDDLPSFEEIEAKLPVAINQTTVTVVNSVDGREVPWRNGYAHVLVGGEKLGRGYTVKGLTVTYMPRSPGGWTADTIQQRARFFGYHQDHLGFCRIYLHPNVRQVYASYVSHEHDMRSRLADHRGRPLQEWRRLFYLDRRLAPTRRNVLMSPWMRSSLRSGWFAPRAPQIAREEGRINSRLLDRLNGMEFVNDEAYPRHKWAVVHLREIFEEVLVPLSYLYEDDAAGLCVVNCSVKTLLERDEGMQCVIYQMDSGRPRDRFLTRGIIPQFFQGRSSAGSDSYPGDRAFFHQRFPTLQVHSLRLLEGGQPLVSIQALAVRVGKYESVLEHNE